MPDLRSLPRTCRIDPTTGYGGIQIGTGCARSLRSLRLPSVARLEFIPMKIGAGMTTFLETVSLWTDSIITLIHPIFNGKGN